MMPMNLAGDYSPWFYSTLVTALAGLCPVLFIKHSTCITAKERYAITSGSWIAVCLFGMLPFLMYGHGFTLVNALFESVSGFTTTGASILNDIESLPAGLVWTFFSAQAINPHLAGLVWTKYRSALHSSTNGVLGVDNEGAPMKFVHK